MSPSADYQLVRRLIRERLETEPAFARQLVTDPMLFHAVEAMRVTLEALVSYAQSESYGNVEVAALVRGTLARLLRDDLLALQREAEFRVGGL